MPKKIEKELSTSAEMVVYIIKLVYRKSVYKLPNFMIRSREDIALCRDKLKNIKEKQVIEIWYCKMYWIEKKYMEECSFLWMNYFRE